MRELTLDTSLEIRDIFGKEISEYRLRAFGENIVVNELNEGKPLFNGVLDYYRSCYSNHYGMVISIDHLWHIVLNEVARYVSENVEECRDVFTTSPDKITISVPTGDYRMISTELLVENLKELVPSDVDLFVPNFSVYQPSSYFGICAAFCDVVSPYYDYMTFACGFRGIRIIGSQEDFDLARDNILKIGHLLPGLKDYSHRVSNTLHSVYHGTEESLTQIFTSQREGSGSYLWINGWLKELFLDNSARRYNNFPEVVSKVNYTNLETGKKFTLFTGVLSAEQEGDYLIPLYKKIVNEND